MQFVVGGYEGNFVKDWPCALVSLRGFLLYPCQAAWIYDLHKEYLTEILTCQPLFTYVCPYHTPLKTDGTSALRESCDHLPECNSQSLTVTPMGPFSPKIHK